MRSYREVLEDKEYKPSSDEIKTLSDALNLVGLMYNCNPYWAEISDNIYAEAFYNRRAIPAVWSVEGEEYYTYVWFKILENNRDVEVKIGPNILEIETTQVFKNNHTFCYEACNEVFCTNSLPSVDIKENDKIEDCEPINRNHYIDYDECMDEIDSSFDEFYKKMERINRDGFDIDELRTEAQRKHHQKMESREMWVNEISRLVRLSKKNEYIEKWESEYGSRPENTPYDDVW